jgi:hypothetical protein
MGAAEVGALVTDASWGKANAPMVKRRMAENFIVILGRIEALRYNVTCINTNILKIL